MPDEQSQLQKWLEISYDLKKAKAEVFKKHNISETFFRKELTPNALLEFKSCGGVPVEHKEFVLTIHSEQHRIVPEQTPISFTEEKLVLHHK
jgi:hypothetical protein